MPNNSLEVNQAFLVKYLSSHAVQLFCKRFQILGYGSRELAVLREKLPACEKKLGRKLQYVEFELLLITLLGESYKKDINKHPGIKHAVQYAIAQYKSRPKVRRMLKISSANKRLRQSAQREAPVSEGASKNKNQEGDAVQAANR